MRKVYPHNLYIRLKLLEANIEKKAADLAFLKIEKKKRCKRILNYYGGK